MNMPFAWNRPRRIIPMRAPIPWRLYTLAAVEFLVAVAIGVVLVGLMPWDGR